MRTNTIAETFDRLPGDLATYSLGDCERVVRTAKESGTVAVDIETRGLGRKRFDLTAISIATTEEAHILDPGNEAHVRAAAEAVSAAKTLIFHNSTFDVPPLVRAGVMTTDDIDKVVDTLVAARLAWPDKMVRKSLGAVSGRLLGEDYVESKDGLKTGWKATTGRSYSEMWETVDLSQPAFRAYASWDSLVTARVWESIGDVVRKTLTDHPFDQVSGVDSLLQREMIVNRVMLGASCRGIEIDYDVVDEVLAQMKQVISDCDESLLQEGIDEQSHPKIQQIVVDRLFADGLLPASWPKLQNGRPSARKTWLEKVDHPLVDIVTRRGMALHFLRDYAEKFLNVAIDGRIHPEVAVLGATTGRSAYGSPPLQQYPADVRRMMCNEVGMTSLDWTSIEPVLGIYFAGEDSAIEQYEAGADIYQHISEVAGIPRKTAKTTWLAQFYGQGRPSLAIRLGIDEDEAGNIIHAVMSRMPKVRKMIDRIRQVGNQYGMVQTMSGRIIPVPTDPEKPGRFKGYMGVNYVVQGSAYDILAESLVRIHDRGLDSGLIACVHDEIVCTTAVADDVRQIMESPPDSLIEMVGRRPVLRTDRDDMGTHWTVSE